MRNITLLILTSLASLVFSPLAALAQSDTVVNEDEIPAASFASDLSPKGLVSCFDYYQFGSVQAHISPSVVEVVSGTPILFAGELTNDNPYPVVDGALYVKIFRTRDNGGVKNANGPHVVDQFFVEKDIALPANGSKPIEFEWEVPSHALSSEYQVATFFITSDKFNLLGLSFTDDVTGNTESFQVSGERSTGVYFNKDTVSINDRPYYFAAYPPRFEEEELITVVTEIVNETDEEVMIPITWKLHYWDAQHEDNLIEERQEEVSVPANGSTELEYTIEDTDNAVYLLEGTSTWKDAKSIVNVRLGRSGNDRARINFPSVTAFPLVEDEEVELFSCFHNAGFESQLPDGRLELQLVDTDGHVIHEYIYNGAITSAMMGVADTFTPARTYDAFRLEANLYQNDQLVDNVIVEYNCEDIDPSQCLSDEEKQTASLLLTMPLLTILGSILGAILLVGVYMLWRRRQRKNEDLVNESIQ
jgi:hypothetical protein